MFKQSGNASVLGFADYYKDVIQDDTYTINNINPLGQDFDHSDEYTSAPNDVTKRFAGSRASSRQQLEGKANFNDSYEQHLNVSLRDHQRPASQQSLAKETSNMGIQGRKGSAPMEVLPLNESVVHKGSSRAYHFNSTQIFK